LINAGEGDVTERSNSALIKPIPIYVQEYEAPAGTYENVNYPDRQTISNGATTPKDVYYSFRVDKGGNQPTNNNQLSY